ncbi:AUX/IAA domain [Dillenia turbinata]|uniref:Auxin-responsive protein n=1 Tax=Dillenia turbinata TaxID=194707 RepID=A0AAN8VDW3_9MAGN
MENMSIYKGELNLKDTELRLGLPGTDESEKEAVIGVRNNKRSLSVTSEESRNEGGSDKGHGDSEAVPATKAQIVGWPPIRSYRKNSFQPKNNESEASGMYVKVSMDGAPYLRKIDLKVYIGYPELLKALENMFKLTIGKIRDNPQFYIVVMSMKMGILIILYTTDFSGEYSEREGYKGSEYEPAYEDKDGDWMLVGDVPWEMFVSSCKRLRIMKGSEGKGLGCAI